MAYWSTVDDSYGGVTPGQAPTPTRQLTPEEEYGQLAWMMSMQGLDPNNPDDVEKFVANWNGATTIPGSTLPNTAEGRAQHAENTRINLKSNPVSQSTNWALMDDEIRSREGINDPFINNYISQIQGTNARNSALLPPVQAAAGKTSTAADQLGALTSGWQQQSAQSAAAANAADQSTLAQYQSTIGGLNDFARGNYDTFANNLNSQPILSAGGYGPYVVSQAQNAQANPQDIANQYAAYSQLGAFASGAYDYQSQAAQAYADPQADAQFRAGINELHDIAGGSKDVKPGELDPEAYAALVDAREKYRGLTTPGLTAAERFMMEQARMKQEQGERALRGAALSSLRERGMSGGSSELLSGAMGARQMSQNRLLSDLGAQANAVNRSMEALQGYAQVSNAMNTGANQLQTANRDRQLAAQGMYVDASGQLRRDTFQEAYARGVAADQATQFNTTTKLNATNMQGQLSTAMRTQSFNEDFSRKSAADQMAQFNKAQSQISQRWQEQYAADQQRDYTTRQNLISQAGDRYTTTASNNATNLANAGFGVNAAGDARTQGSLTSQSGLGMNAITGYNAASGGQLGSGQFGYQTNQGNLGNTASGTGLIISNNDKNTNRRYQSWQDKLGANAADMAIYVTNPGSPPVKKSSADNAFDAWQNGEEW